MTLPAFLQRIFSRPVQHKVVVVNPVAMTLDMWRASASLVDQSRTHSGTEMFKAQIQVLKNETPGVLPMPIGTAATDRLVQQGRVEGYNECLRKLQLFSVFKRLPNAIEATFEPPEEKAA